MYDPLKNPCITNILQNDYYLNILLYKYTMFISKRPVRGEVNYYLDYSLTLGSLKKHYMLFIGPKLDEKAILEQYYKIITTVTLDRTKYILSKHQTTLKEPEIYRLEEIRTKLDVLKKVLPESYKSYKEDEFVKYAQGTSAVEGNPIKLQEAKEILEKGVSISGYSIRDVKEVENIGKVRIYLEKRKEITEKVLQKAHTILLDGFNDKKPGEYREAPMFITASKVKPLHESKIKEEIKKIFLYYKENKDKLYPLDLASELHIWFEYTHPFYDGNGRLGRELLNFILLKNKFPRVIINLKNRLSYINTLETLQLEKNYKKFAHYIYLQLDNQFKELEEIIKESENTIIKKLIKNLG